MNVEEPKEMVANKIKNAFMEGYKSGALNSLQSLEEVLLSLEQTEKTLFALDLVRQCKKLAEQQMSGEIKL